MSKYLYIIDNGHGIDTNDKESPFFINGEKFYEYAFNRSVAKFLSFELKSKHIDYHLLVPEEKNIYLKERVLRANKLQSKRKCILISIHADKLNSAPEANGISVFYKSNKGKALACIFQNCLINSLRLKDRGIREANYYILKYTSMPSVLTENGFIPNWNDLGFSKEQINSTKK